MPCRELALERDERLDNQRDVDARIAAVEASLRARPASVPETPSKSSLAVVGGFGSLTRDAALAKVAAALAQTPGFVRVIEERCGQVPKVVVCDFTNHNSMMDAVRNQKSNELLNGMWMAPDRTLAERQEYQRLFTVKRGIVEITKRAPESVIVHKPSRKLFSPSGENLIEIRHVPKYGSIEWADSIQSHVREHIAAMAPERMNMHRH